MNTLLLENQLCFKLYALSRKVRSEYRPLLEKLGVTYPQYLVLLVLWEEQSLTVNELGAQLHLDSGTLTPLLKRLQEKSMVNRTRDPQDERRVLIELTKEGESLKSQAECIPEKLRKKLGTDKHTYNELIAQLDDLLIQLQ